jgi:hypothetical protein
VPATTLPEDGELRLETVTLPAGRRIHGPGTGTTRTPVAWITATRVPDPGRVWSRLSDLSEQTGLVPFLAVTRRGYQGRPWTGRIATDLNPFDDPAAADRFDAAAVLTQRWAGRAEGQDEYADPEEERRFRAWEAARIAPFTQFPGLTPATAQALSPGELAVCFDSLPPTRIGLAAAGRPADALIAMGWYPGNWWDGQAPMTAVLRSWEDRFGARLLAVDRIIVRLLVTCPPRDQATALRIAAEQWAFAYECWPGKQTGLNYVNDIATHLMNEPTWGFYWD